MRQLTQTEMAHVSGHGINNAIFVLAFGGAVGVYYGLNAFAAGMGSICTMFNQTIENCAYALNATLETQELMKNGVMSFGLLGAALGVAGFGTLVLVGR